MYEFEGIDRSTALRALIAYCICAIVPFLVSSSFAVRLLGVFAGIACLSAYLMWFWHFVSVWCFFAALISLGVYAVMLSRRHQRLHRNEALLKTLLGARDNILLRHVHLAQ